MYIYKTFSKYSTLEYVLFILAANHVLIMLVIKTHNPTH